MTVQLSEPEIALVNKILAHHLGNMDYRIFGSRAQGTAEPHSNLEVVLLSTDPIPPLKLSNLEEGFAQSDLPFKVDIIDWQRITPAFQEKIKQEWKKI